MSEGLAIWTIYDHPKDYPDGYIARLWRGEIPTDEVVTSARLDDIRMGFAHKGLYCIARQPDDDPVIVENWL